jgi:hypothetical protein
MSEFFLLGMHYGARGAFDLHILPSQSTGTRPNQPSSLEGAGLAGCAISGSGSGNVVGLCFFGGFLERSARRIPRRNGLGAEIGVKGKGLS